MLFKFIYFKIYLLYIYNLKYILEYILAKNKLYKYKIVKLINNNR